MLKIGLFCILFAPIATSYGQVSSSEVSSERSPESKNPNGDPSKGYQENDLRDLNQNKLEDKIPDPQTKENMDLNDVPSKELRSPSEKRKLFKKRKRKHRRKKLRKKRDVGAGIIIGGVTGLSLNFKLRRYRSVDAALSISSPIGSTRYKFSTYSTYIFHVRSPLSDNYPLFWYSGLGLRIYSLEIRKSRDEVEKSYLSIGPRASLGVRLVPRKSHLEFFGEGSINVSLVDTVEAYVDIISLGARYYF